MDFQFITIAFIFKSKCLDQISIPSDPQKSCLILISTLEQKMIPDIINLLNTTHKYLIPSSLRNV